MERKMNASYLSPECARDRQIMSLSHESNC